MEAFNFTDLESIKALADTLADISARKVSVQDAMNDLVAGISDQALAAWSRLDEGQEAVIPHSFPEELQGLILDACSGDKKRADSARGLIDTPLKRACTKAQLPCTISLAYRRLNKDGTIKQQPGFRVKTAKTEVPEPAMVVLAATLLKAAGSKTMANKALSVAANDGTVPSVADSIKALESAFPPSVEDIVAGDNLVRRWMRENIKG